VRESQLLEHIFARTRDIASRFEQVLVGPGHDCAVVGMGDGRRGSLLLKVDQVIEGRHFTSQTPISLIGRKALARPLSDIAAAGGTPLCALVAATLPANSRFTHEQVIQLVDAVHDAGGQFDCPVVGGDIARHADPNGPLQLSVSVVGRPHALRGPVLRSGVRVGDFLYVTGELGGSFRAAPDETFGFPGGGKHLMFTPRLAEAKWLADALGDELHAMMDISDGLGRDAGRMARRSNVVLELDASRIPLAAGVQDVRSALGDGEDYELLFASPRAPMPATIGPNATPVRLIGVASARTGEHEEWDRGDCVVRWPDGRIEDIGNVGWDHG